MSQVVFKAAESDEELRLAVDLMAQARHASHIEAVRWGETVGAGHPNSRPEHTRVAMVENEVAGALRITTDTIRIGEARLKMGGIGWIATSPRYKNQGISRHLINHTMQFLKKQNYNVAMLFTQHNFYRTLGFAMALNDYRYVVDTMAALEISAPEFRVRESKPGDITAMQRLHEAGEARVACSIVRNRAHFVNRWDVWRNAQVLIDQEGRVAGYFLPRLAEHALLVEESAGINDEARAAIIKTAAGIAMEESRHRMVLSLPPSHPCAQFLERRAGDLRLKEEREVGGLMACVQRAETLESLVPEWESALERDPLADQHVEVALVVARQQYRITAHRGAIGITSGSSRDKLGLKEGELLQLITGHTPLEDILERHVRMLSPKAHALLRLMFPQRAPFVWPADRF